MAIITEVNEWNFRNAFKESRQDNFSLEGLYTLYNYLNDLSEDIGEDIQLDIISICCDFNEYESLEEALNQYDDINTLEELEQHTSILNISMFFDNHKGIIIQAF
tara:strand:+ start:212 stop:526 length:315 start_codon:yes stop_codon:yes gene_type:complete